MDNPHRARFEHDGYYIAANVLHQDLVDRLNALGDHILAQQDPSTSPSTRLPAAWC